MKQTQPATAYRAAIHNQIYSTIYYKVSEYQLNPKTGKYRYVSSYGTRCAKAGRGLNLGMTKADAFAESKKQNAAEGWTSTTENAPSFLRDNVI